VLMARLPPICGMKSISHCVSTHGALTSGENSGKIVVGSPVEVRRLRLTPFFYRGAVLTSHCLLLGERVKSERGQGGDEPLMLRGSLDAATGSFVYE
jgi:hypothetical protein